MKTYTYKTVGDVKIEADVYRADDAQPRPVLLWLHGGALVVGNRQNIRPDMLDLCRAEGYCLVSPDQRLAPEAKLPQIIEDLQDSIRWVNEKGPGLFHAEPSRIVVAGNSSGGYLTLMAGLCKPRPKALVSYWGFGKVGGPVWGSRSPNPTVSKEEAEKAISKVPLTNVQWNTKVCNDRLSKLFAYLAQNGLLAKEVLGFDAGDQKGLGPYCPVRNITPKYPPTLLLHGEAGTSVPCQESRDMAEQLEKNGVRYELITVPGAGHGLGGGDTKLVDKATARARGFIKEMLGSQAAPQQ